MKLMNYIKYLILGIFLKFIMSCFKNVSKYKTGKEDNKRLTLKISPSTVTL